MNVTFLIGNGFDINLGLDTRYSDFVKVYKNMPAKQEVIKEFRKNISENSELWADAEIALGEYTNNFKAGEGALFSDCKEDFCVELSRYLKNQELRIDYDISKEAIQKAFLNLNKITNSFPAVERDFLNRTYQSHLSEPVKFNFINFNYTKTLDMCIKTIMKDKQFKAVNREENYIKNNAPDMRLGRHSETAPQPRQSTSRKMKKYQARQPTIGAESAAAPEQQGYGGYTADTGNTDTDLQISNSDTVHYAENADLQVTPRNKNRIYQKHTQFAQKAADYDFTKENQTQDFSFTDTTETYSPDTAEQPENVAEETADIPQNHLEGGAQTEPPKRSHKQCYHSRNPRREKDADFNISETAKETDYSFTDVKSDTSFDRSERKTGNNAKPTDKAVRKRIYQTQRDNTAKEPAAETEPSEDYDISDAAKNADKPFDYVSDSGGVDSKQTAKHKKNARLQEKRRLQTDDAVSSDTADGNDKSESADNTTADNGKDDFQFNRAAKAERRAEKAQAKADKAEEKLPHKKKIKRQRLYDKEKQKPKNRLVFENEIKPQKDLYHRTPVKAVVSEIGMQAA